MAIESAKDLGHLVAYAEGVGLIGAEDRTWALNSLLDVLRLDGADVSVRSDSVAPPLHEVLDALVDSAASRGLLVHDSITYRDLLDTALMGRLTPSPREVHATFRELLTTGPQLATDWYYRFSQDTNYIRRDRMAKDRHWQADTAHGVLDITINLAKPEKDPLAIAATRGRVESDYPRCQLCPENEGYAGRADHPARQNHRVVPVTLAGSRWHLQYSPYAYYNEHCIVFDEQHSPMRIDRACFARLLDFVDQFPHYFVGSNADLPIVGGSILTHDHFQGGRHTFPMERAPLDEAIAFVGFEDVSAGIVRWPLSVIRLSSHQPDRLIDLADRILDTWRSHTDADAFVYASSHGEPHNTITPVARRRGAAFELDLVLRNNITTAQHPLGVYHPHAELHHIKKENIGLIEVMGLAVLPARLQDEIAAVATHLINGTDLRDDPLTAKHADWADGFTARITPKNLTPEDVTAVLEDEIGQVFAQVLEHAGVYRQDRAGRAAFHRFIDAVNRTGETPAKRAVT